MEEKKKRNFFISHSSVDKVYAEWIAWTLEEAGYSTLIDSWDFPKGKGFIDCMNEGLADCDQMIIVASPEYWKANYTNPEWKYFFKLESEHGKIKIFLVAIQSSTVPPVLSDKLRIVLSDIVDESEAKNLLMRELPEDIERNHSFKRSPSIAKPPFPSLSQNHVDENKFLYRLGNLNQTHQQDHFYDLMYCDSFLNNGKTHGFIVTGPKQELPKIIVFTLSHVLKEFLGETPNITELKPGNWRMYARKQEGPEEFLWDRFNLTSDIQNIKSFKDRKHQIKAELEKQETCHIFYREILSHEARNQQFLLDTLLAWSELGLVETSPSHFLLLICETDSIGDDHEFMMWKQSFEDLLEKNGRHESMLPPQTSPSINQDLLDWMIMWTIEDSYREKIFDRLEGKVKVPLKQLKNELCAILKDYPFDNSMNYE